MFWLLPVRPFCCQASPAAGLLQYGCRCHKLRKTFFKFYRRHYELVSRFSVGLRTLLHRGLSEPEFCGDFVYGFREIVGRAGFSDQFRKIVVRCGRVGYGVNIVRRPVCVLSVWPGRGWLLCFSLWLRAGGSGVGLGGCPGMELFFFFCWMGPGFFVCCLARRGSAVGFLLLQYSSCVVRHPRDRSQHVSVESSSLFHRGVCLWFVCFSWWSFDELENLHADRTSVCFEP